MSPRKWAPQSQVQGGHQRERVAEKREREGGAPPQGGSLEDLKGRECRVCTCKDDLDEILPK